MLELAMGFFLGTLVILSGLSLFITGIIVEATFMDRFFFLGCGITLIAVGVVVFYDTKVRNKEDKKWRKQ